jgi:hypothetical protein
MLNLAQLQHHMSSASDHGGTISNVQLVAYPFYDSTTSETSLTSALVAKVQTSNPHTVVLAYREAPDGSDEYAFWCGDRFLDGGLTAHDVATRSSDAAKPFATKTGLAAQMSALAGTYGTSTGCSFWKNWNKSKEPCKHVKSFLKHLSNDRPDIANELKNHYQQLTASPAAASGSGAEEMLSIFDLGFRVPVLIEGDRGAGKTLQAREFARFHQCAVVEYGGHEGTEAIDLLGHLVPYLTGQMVWKDGPVSEAFRRAMTEKVVLILDELKRIPQRQLSILLTALSPDRGMYRLRTGRVVSVTDGVAVEEVLECPVENLCIVATTNVGAQYQVDASFDPAIDERFVTLRKDTESAELRRILLEWAMSKSFDEHVVTKSMMFYEYMVTAVKAGSLHEAPTTRTMVRGFELASVEADVIRVLRTQRLLWIARSSDGKPVDAQVKIVEKLLKKAFSSSTAGATP